MAQRRSRAMWIWREAVTALFVALLLWGDLPRGLEEFVLIGLGTGILIMGAELVRGHSCGANLGQGLTWRDPVDLETSAMG